MKKTIFTLLIVLYAVCVDAAESDIQLDTRRADTQRVTNWIVMEKVTRTQVKRVGTAQNAYFFFVRDGKENFVTVNATTDPTVYSYLFTAYLTGAPVKVQLTSSSGFVVVAEMGR